MILNLGKNHIEYFSYKDVCGMYLSESRWYPTWAPSRRLRWPIGRNEGRKMFEGWIVTRDQLLTNTRTAHLEDGTSFIVDNYPEPDDWFKYGLDRISTKDLKKNFPNFYAAYWSDKLNDIHQYRQAFDKYGQEIH